MAFNLGALFSAIGRALPGYIQGREEAIKDNWNDLSQYNQVQKGQLENAWTEATWEPRLSNVSMQTANNEFQTEANAMGLQVARNQLLGQMQNARDQTQLIMRGDMLPQGTYRAMPYNPYTSDPSTWRIPQIGTPYQQPQQQYPSYPYQQYPPYPYQQQAYPQQQKRPGNPNLTPSSGG